MALLKLSLHLTTIVFILLTQSEAETTCGSLKQDSACKCKFLEDSDVGVTKTEILAGAIGAMSPLLLSGVGFGIWKFIQSKSSLPSFKRAPSDLSEETADDSKQRWSKGNGRVTPEHNMGRRGSSSSEYSYARRNKSPLSITDTDSEYSFIDTPTRMETPDTGQEVNWSPTGRPAPATVADPNRWMF